MRQVWERALAGEAYTEVGQFGESARDRRSYEMHFRPLKDSSGNVVGAYQFVYDVTERLDQQAKLVAAETALQQSQKMEAVGLLTGGIAHDFNNLLQAARMNFELIRRHAGDADRVVRGAEKGVDITRRGAKLTAQLLAFSRHRSFDVAPVSLQALFAGMAELLRTTAGPKVAFSVSLADESLWAMADGTQLEMSLLNMVLNARDAMPDGGTLRVEVEICPIAPEGLAPGDYVALRVVDTGMGMDESVARRAFEPFYTTKGAGKGTGLGLSQVYGMATRAGGTARIASRSGEGTTIEMILPRCTPACIDERTSAFDQDAGDFATMSGTVLLIDDDADVRRELVDALQSFGLTVLEADSGEAGLSLLETTKIDLVLVDFAMPGLNGAAVAHLALERQPDLPLIFISGYSDDAAIHAAVGRNVALMRKPVDLRTLQAAVQAELQTLLK